MCRYQINTFYLNPEPENNFCGVVLFVLFFLRFKEMCGMLRGRPAVAQGAWVDISVYISLGLRGELLLAPGLSGHECAAQSHILTRRHRDRQQMQSTASDSFGFISRTDVKAKYLPDVQIRIARAFGFEYRLLMSGIVKFTSFSECRCRHRHVAPFLSFLCFDISNSFTKSIQLPNSDLCSFLCRTTGKVRRHLSVRIILMRDLLHTRRRL